jgi:PhnB protein
MASKKNGAKKAAKKPINPVPRQYGSVTPTMNQTDAAATIAFCKKAFGAKLLNKMPGPGGKLMHAEIQIGDSIVMLSDAVMEPARVSSLFMYVPKVDKAMEKAVKAGAEVIMPAEDMFWGDRFGRLKDPFGNLWALASRFEKVAPVELKKRMKAETKRMAVEAKGR